MKIYTFLFCAFIGSIILLATPSCKKNKDCTETNIGTSGGDDSHNFGMNCMNCHKSGGEGKGCFTVAGSVSNSSLTSPLTAGTVKLYTAANGGGTLKHSIQIDSKGWIYQYPEVGYTNIQR